MLIAFLLCSARREAVHLSLLYNILNVRADFIRNVVKRIGILHPGDQQQFRMPGRLAFSREELSEVRNALQQRNACLAAHDIAPLDASDDEVLPLMADMHLRLEIGCIQARGAVAIPAKKAGSSDFQRQDGRLAGHDRCHIQFEKEAIGGLRDLFIPMFEFQIRAIGEFVAAVYDLLVELAGRNGRFVSE